MRGSREWTGGLKLSGSSQVAMISFEMLVRTSLDNQLDPLTPLEKQLLLQGGPYGAL